MDKESARENRRTEGERERERERERDGWAVRREFWKRERQRGMGSEKGVWEEREKERPAS